MTMRLRAYSCLQDMYESFSAAVEELKFENHKYRLKGSRRKFDQIINLYHCAEEQHYIVIYTKFNLPVLIKPFYSVNEVKLADL